MAETAQEGTRLLGETGLILIEIYWISRWPVRCDSLGITTHNEDPMKKVIASLALVLAIAASTYFVASQAGSTTTNANACTTTQCE